MAAARAGNQQGTPQSPKSTMSNKIKNFFIQQNKQIMEQLTKANQPQLFKKDNKLVIKELRKKGISQVYKEKGLDQNFHAGFLDLNQKNIKTRQQKGLIQSKFAMLKIKNNLKMKIDDMKAEILWN